MLDVQQPPRIFRIEHDGKPLDLTDPNPAFGIKEVIGHYSVMYPQITNYSAGKEPFFENDCLVYEINSVLGEHS